MRLNWALSISLLLCYIVPAQAQDFDNEHFCAYMKQLADSINKENPMWVDPATRHDGIAVLCALKMIEYKKFINGRASDLRTGWQSREQNQWNELFCQEPTLSAVINGWSIFSLWTFVDVKQQRWTAKCD